MSRRVAILGLGSRGLRWCEAAARAGWEVSAFDPDDRIAVPGPGIRRQKTISATVRRADWVICCLPERLELIQMVLQRIQAEAPREAVVAVGSRELEIDAIQGCAIRPAQVMRVQESPGGGLSLDVSQKNDESLRAGATETLAVFAAALALVPVAGAGNNEALSRGARFT